MTDLGKYESKLLALKEVFAKKSEGLDTEVKVVLPGDEDWQEGSRYPYVKVRYYIDRDKFEERKIDLHDSYLEKDLQDLVNFIEHFIQEFEMEIDQTNYGGG